MVVGEQKEIMKKLIPKYCVAGAEIWTDSAKSYEWLHEGHEEQGVLSSVSGFVHSWIKHCDWEFARAETSTNGVEALFSRVKRYLRIIRCTKVTKRTYGAYLTEFIWREKLSSGRALGTAF